MLYCGMPVFEIHVHNHLDTLEILQELKSINKKLDKMANSIQELTTKVDALQTALDTEQEQIKAAIDGLTQTVTDLQALVAEGGTAEERQALADKLDAITTDLKGTIADAPEA